MITKETQTLTSHSVAIHYDIYLDSTRQDYKALILIAHGMIEHREKYAPIATFLAQRGFIVAINDHRGHGDSINCEFRGDSIKADSIKGNSAKCDSTQDSAKMHDSDKHDSHITAHNAMQGDTPQIVEKIYLGEMGENGFEMALMDMYNLHLALKSRFNPPKFVLIGHSMGSLLARRFLQDYEKSLDMLILCGSPSPQRFIKIGIGFLKILHFFGVNNIARHIANRFSLLAFNAKYARFDKLKNGKNSGTLWINRDTAELQKAIANKKSYFTFTINSFICLFCGLERVFSKYRRATLLPKLPILFISGEDDACGGFGKGVLRAFKHLKSQGYENAKLILYANARHELFLELNKDEVFNDVLCFLEENL